MSQIYQSFAFSEEDTVQERMTKLYLGIISVGEDLYCKGSHLSELNKQLNQYERMIAEMRKELDELKARAAVES
jgi:hypothetical protein